MRPDYSSTLKRKPRPEEPAQCRDVSECIIYIYIHTCTYNHATTTTTTNNNNNDDDNTSNDTTTTNDDDDTL